MELPKVVVSALVEKDDKFLLVKETVESGKDHWLIPGGKVEFGESLIQAVKREMKEETNLEIEITKLIDFEEAINTKYNYHTIIFFFHARQLGGDLAPGEGIKEARFFTKEEMQELDIIDSGKWLLKRYGLM